jgi:hypothetical protein
MYGGRTVNYSCSNRSGNRKAPVYGAFGEADDGTRTHDLLHGKQTL